MATNTDNGSKQVWTVIIIAAVIGAGYWYYQNNLKQTVDKVNNAGSFLGIF